MSEQRRGGVWTEVPAGLDAVGRSGPFSLGCAQLGNLYHAISDDDAFELSSKRRGTWGCAGSTPRRTTASACPNNAWARSCGSRPPERHRSS